MEGVAPDFRDEFAQVRLAVGEGDGNVGELGGRVVAGDGVVEFFEQGLDPTQFHTFTHAEPYDPTTLRGGPAGGRQTQS